MNKTQAYFFFIFPLLLLLLHVFPLFADANPTGIDAFSPERNERNLPLADGFAALKWGTSIEGAQRIYPDLREVNTKTYNEHIKGKREFDGVHTDLLRSSEDLRVGGYVMDSIEYNFLEGKFYTVGMTIHCDGDTSCNVEQIFQSLVKAIRTIYGKPYRISSTTFEKDDIVKKWGGIVKNYLIEWEIEDESIKVSKTVYPKSSYIIISIFSYQGYFKATGQER